MNLRLYDKTMGYTLMEKAYPNPITHDNSLTETITHLDHFGANGYYKEIFFEGIHIGYGNAKLAREVNLGFETDFETIEMHFALKGKSSAIAEKFGKSISFDSYRHNIIYANGLCGEMKWEEDIFQLCEINLAPHFFKRFLPENHKIYDSFRNTIEQQNSNLLNTQHYQITLQMHQIIHDITNCKREGIFKRMFLESKVIELLMLQLEQFTYNESFTTSTLKKKDTDKIHAVREYIINHIDSTYSLIDLAHLVGTNEFMLKKGFKELFGTTVFSFWNDLKMEKAKALLIDNQLNIGDVSYQMGYQNQRSFSAAFKRKYGILPSQIRK
ncbi:AraC family transcriptional regulator [Chishuiella sp.]|uniref:helix-turn-helix domain-containing protein n=1 Tax=Chishuiella sp. TaxID=1969467 RepID=UPI0028AFE28C|nr:AraC family transcriptional regulator [Chishuiella sp.]